MVVSGGYFLSPQLRQNVFEAATGCASFLQHRAPHSERQRFMETNGLALCDSPETSPCAGSMLGMSYVHTPISSLSDLHSHRQMRAPGGHRHFWKGRATRVAGEASEGTTRAERGKQKGLGREQQGRIVSKREKSFQLFKNTSNYILCLLFGN